MKTPITQRRVLALANCSDAERLKFLKRMTAAELLALDAAFEAWAATGQVAPSEEGWRVMFRLTDPLDFSRLARRAAIAPFVP